jgi:cytidylate kinase
VDDILDEFFGLRPPSWVLVPQMVETIVHLAQKGHVILIGRGATVVTSQIPNVFHVRLVASLASRVERVQKSHSLTAREATQFIKREDRGRQRYVESNLHAHLDDELLYHMVINTDRISCEEAARVIAHAARRCFANAFPAFAAEMR